MKLAMLIAFALPAFAHAAPPDEARQRVDKRMHMARLLVLTEELGLADEKALKVNKLLDQFEERRKKLNAQTRDARQAIQRAANGDDQAVKELDASVEKLVEARKAADDLDREVYRGLAKELSPVQRAKFVLAMAEFRRHMERMAWAARGRMGGQGMGQGGRQGWRDRMEQIVEGGPGGP